MTKRILPMSERSVFAGLVDATDRVCSTASLAIEPFQRIVTRVYLLLMTTSSVFGVEFIRFKSHPELLNYEPLARRVYRPQQPEPKFHHQRQRRHSRYPNAISTLPNKLSQVDDFSGGAGILPSLTAVDTR